MSFVFRNFPSREIHPWAEAAAEVAESSGTHGKFWEMHHLLFGNQKTLDEETFPTLLKRLGLPGSELEQARSNGASKKRIDSDFAGAIRTGANAAPSFFLNGERYDDPADHESLIALMDEVLISNGD